ncbi:hypothetical protein [Streptomyces sp. NPDC047009]|uniref:hypothetical protein n=1 Tax=unclassified Streptomyces TaxID=2593676 RepID=UPI0033CE9439
MRKRRIGTAAAAVLAALLVPAAAPAFGVATTGTTTPTVQPLTSGISDQQTHTVTLVTGDQVAVSQKGSATPRVSVLNRTAGVGYLTYTLHGDTYVIPSSAQPYAGRQLDLNLFNVSKMIRDGRADSADVRIPVHLDYTGQARPTTPGVVLTDSGTDGADGYITPKTAHLFGEALTSQNAANVKAGPGQTAFLGGVASLSTGQAAPTSGSTVTPHFPMRTTRVDALDAAGNPVPYALVLILNADDLNRAAEVVPVINGTARVSLPAGNYAAIRYDDTFDDTGHLTAVRQVTQNNFVISDDPSQHPSVTLDARDASAPVTMSTSQPTTVQYTALDWSRKDATGKRTAANYIAGGDTHFLVKPEGTADVGKLFFAAQARLLGTGRHTSDAYNVVFTDDQVRANQHWTAANDRFATVPYRYASDLPTARPVGLQTEMTVGDHQQGELVWPVSNVTAPGTYNEHFLTGPDTRWGGVVMPWSDHHMAEAFLIHHPGPLKPHRYAPVTWGHGPLVPHLPQPGYACNICRWGTQMRFYLDPLSDDELHTGGPGPGSATQNIQLYFDDHLIADMDGSNGALLTDVPADRHKYQIVFDQKRSGDSFTHGTHSHTEWTFPSEATTKGDLPGQMCGTQDSDPSCQQLPALSVTHRLNTDDAGVSRDKTTVLHVKVANNSPTKSSPTTASVQVSFDHGATWQTAHLLQHRGQVYAFRWRNPDSARGTMPVLRIQAHDTAHSSFSETVWDAYTVGPVN